jgi:hypothetical protein
MFLKLRDLLRDMKYNELDEIKKMGDGLMLDMREISDRIRK